VLDRDKHVLGLAGAVLPDARGHETARSDDGGAGFAEAEGGGEDRIGALERNLFRSCRSFAGDGRELVE
jgi:hypothetical protein